MMRKAGKRGSKPQQIKDKRTKDGVYLGTLWLGKRDLRFQVWGTWIRGL